MNADSTTRPPVTSTVRRAPLRSLSCVLLLMLIPAVVFATGGLPDGWISFDGVTVTPTAPRLQIISSSSSQIQLIISTPGMLCETIEHDGTDYKRLSFPEYFHSTVTGDPALPAVRQLLAMPRGCEISVSATAMDSLLYTDCVVYPVEAEVIRYTEEGWPYIDYEFALNEQAYSRSGGYPSPRISTGSSGSFRGQGVAKLTSYPVRFDASTSEVCVYPELLVTLDLTGGSGGMSEELGPFGRIAEELLLGYAGVGGGSRLSAGTGRWGVHNSVASCADSLTDYLMIVEESLTGCPAVERLAQHRAEYNGYNVAIVPDAAVIDHHGQQEISSEAIKDFIQSLYDIGSAEHFIDGKLGYVLLVGDARDEANGGLNDLLPAHEAESITTDHWYACVGEEEDWYPDLMIGRLCASDTTELRREVQKFIKYEQEASSADSWRTDVLLTSGFAWLGQPNPVTARTDSTMAMNVHTAFDAVREIMPEGDYAVEEAHAHEQDVGGGDHTDQKDQIRSLHRARVSSGVHLLESCVHGAMHECDTFRRSDVPLLTNTGGQLPFWMNYSCSTGAYDQYEPELPTYDCLGEALMHQNEPVEGGATGALGYFGSSEVSNPAWGNLGLYVWQGIFEDGHHRIGDFITFAKMKRLSRSGDEELILMYNLLGDPAIDIMLTDTGGSGYSSAPDYVVTPLGISLSSMSPPVGSTLTIAVEVENQSNYTPDDYVSVVFEICERDTTVCTPFDTVYVTPPAWGMELAETEWDPQDTDIGHRLLRVTVTPLSGPDELFTDNNTAELPLGVGFDRAGFPHSLWGTEGLSITVADVDGSLPKEIVASVRMPGKVVVYSAAGESLYCFEVPNQAALRGPPAVADLNAHGAPEIVICYGDHVDAIDGASGESFWTLPCHVKGLDSAPVIGDFIAGDAGSLEVVVRSMLPEGGVQPEYGVSVVAIDSNGDKAWSTERMVDGGYTWRESSAACVDLDLDGLPDAVWAISCGGSDTLKAVSGHDGGPLWTTEVEGGTDCHPCNPVAAELDAGSAGPEVVCGGQSLAAFSADGVEIAVQPVAGYVTGIALAEVDGSRPPEIIVVSAGTDGDPSAECGTLYLFEWSGGAFACIGSVTLEYRPFASPVVANLDGDGGPEIIVSSSSELFVGALFSRGMTHIDIFTASPTLDRFEYLDRPLLLWGEPASTPAVVDADQDGYFEIWFADGEGVLHCMEWEEAMGSGDLWPTYQRDARHTGTYETAISGAYPAGSTVSWWGDYLLTGDVAVGATSSLLVQPGTTVRVASDDDQGAGVDPDEIELTIWGDVVAVGDTASAPICFVPAADSRSSIDWYGIKLWPSSSGEFEGCIVKDAFIGISAQSPDEIRIEDCRIVECDVTGIDCIDPPPGSGDILICGNYIADAETGICLSWCDATVDSNMIVNCGSYGIRMISDYESDIIGNTITFPYSPSGGPFSGISVDGTINKKQNALEISDNTITNARTSGITCKNQGLGSEVYISGNVILVEEYHPTSKAMYFDSSRAVPSSNEIDGTRDAFWIESATATQIPNLGIAEEEGGYNSVDETWLRYGVRADPYCLTTVMAEANWWGTANPSEQRFMGLVDWHPFLVADPLERGGSGDGNGVEGKIPFCLMQNSPNPFNPVTALRFGLPARQAVTLSIYNVAGKRVTTLVDDTLDPGWHDVVWDGRDDAHHRVSSGVYFCRLISQGSTSVKKVVLLK